MVSTNLPLPPTISKEAQAFIEQAPEKQQLPFHPDAIAAARQFNQDNWLPEAIAYAKSIRETWTEIYVEGQPVLEVTPPFYNNKNDGKALLYFYGGGHIAGSPEEDLTITGPLAKQLGIKVFAHRYPLSPENPFPAAVDTANKVYTHLISSLGPKNLLVAGESAGGNLALATLLKAREQNLPMPAAAALLSPWVDVGGNSDSHAVDIDPTLSMDSIGNTAARAYLSDDDSKLKDPLASPIYADYDSTFPSTLITTGTRDFLLGDSARLSTKMRLSGVDVQLNVWEGLWHVFEFYPQVPEARQSLQEIGTFLAKHLNA